MKYLGDTFKNRRFDFDKLIKFGFELNGEKYSYNTTIFDNMFQLFITISKDSSVDIRLVEFSTDEDYNLVFIKNAEGEFVGKVRESYENVLEKIRDEATIDSWFQTEYAHEIIKYIKEKYNDEPEYLWEKFPNNAIFRNNDKKRKWYLAILTTKRKSIGLNGDEQIEVINLKANPKDIDKIVDNEKYFRGYHMNKKHWYTICLDKSVHIDEIKTRINKSYDIINS